MKLYGADVSDLCNRISTCSLLIPLTSDSHNRRNWESKKVFIFALTWLSESVHTSIRKTFRLFRERMSFILPICFKYWNKPPVIALYCWWHGKTICLSESFFASRDAMLGSPDSGKRHTHTEQANISIPHAKPMKSSESFFPILRQGFKTNLSF